MAKMDVKITQRKEMRTENNNMMDFSLKLKILIWYFERKYIYKELVFGLILLSKLNLCFHIY